jgi:hypothetical protein
LTSRNGSERTLAATHNEENQVVVGSHKFRAVCGKHVPGAVKEIKRLLLLGVRKIPKIEVTPSRI